MGKQFLYVRDTSEEHLRALLSPSFGDVDAGMRLLAQFLVALDTQTIDTDVQDVYANGTKEGYLDELARTALEPRSKGEPYSQLLEDAYRVAMRSVEEARAAVRDRSASPRSIARHAETLHKIMNARINVSKYNTVYANIGAFAAVQERRPSTVFGRRGKGPAYIVLDGPKPELDANQKLDLYLYNHPLNVSGRLINLVVVRDASASASSLIDALSLSSVRRSYQVGPIREPVSQWELMHTVRRHCSHLQLPSSDEDLSIKIYIEAFPLKTLQALQSVLADSGGGAVTADLSAARASAHAREDIWAARLRHLDSDDLFARLGEHIESGFDVYKRATVGAFDTLRFQGVQGQETIERGVQELQRRLREGSLGQTPDETAYIEMKSQWDALNQLWEIFRDSALFRHILEGSKSVRVRAAAASSIHAGVGTSDGRPHESSGAASGLVALSDRVTD
jgi:hypothetical protein